MTECGYARKLLVPSISQSSKKWPFCGAASLGLPLISAALAYALVAFKPPGDAGWSNVITAAFLVPVCVLSSLVLSIIGVFRGEHWRVLSWAGLLLNAGVVALAVASL